MSSEDKTVTKSGGVEVVADQGDDGSFEIRLERAGDSDETTQPIDVHQTGAWRAEPVEQTARESSLRLPLVIAAGVGTAVVIMGVMALTSSPKQLSGGAPKTVSVVVEPQFRGYIIEGREPARASNLRLELADAFEDGEALDDEAYDAAEYAQPDDLNAPDMYPEARQPANVVRGFGATTEVESEANEGSGRPPKRERLAELERVLGEQVDQYRERREAEDARNANPNATTPTEDAPEFEELYYDEELDEFLEIEAEDYEYYE